MKLIHQQNQEMPLLTLAQRFINILFFSNGFEGEAPRALFSSSFNIFNDFKGF